MPRRLSFTQYTWGLLIYNLLVILWGAFVRASFSGDGCGANWPHCGESVLPQLHEKPAIIEFTHRLSTGILLPMLIVLGVWGWKKFPKNHPVRLGVILTILFTLSEALIGAGLVLFKLVAHNSSMFRALAMSAHLVNTYLLLSSITLTALWSSGLPRMQLKEQGTIAYALFFGFFGLMVLGVSGAITALGDMLFPSATLIEGIKQDFNPAAHLLVRLRPLHPFLAMSVGLYLILIAGLVSHLRPSPQTQRYAKLIGFWFFTQIAVGMLNFLMHAPIPMQIIHLLLSDIIWISLTLLSASALAENVVKVETLQFESAVPQSTGPLPAATWRDYIALTKPRVISLLLFTTLAAMFIARPNFLRADGLKGCLLLIAVAIGGYMAAGAANAINMVIDRDIDGRMRRTAKRPTVTATIPSHHALWFAAALATVSFLLLWGAANILTAVLALAGLVFYVIIYTMLLKRRTWHNIVIGGAAGAFPPLVGWASVTDRLDVLAWFLFVIIFVWTPVHFWALSILLKDEYAEVGVPMLPVVHGVRATVLQITGYAILTAFVSILPVFLNLTHSVGWLYLVSAIALNLLLLFYSVRLYQNPERSRASKLFHYSMLYLALLFLFMAVDRVVLS